jgi:2-dehydro-3-deoxyphosphogluconate aldolase/(4S)-4-hydroxy-2-oxoglutarate aldolase
MDPSLDQRPVPSALSANSRVVAVLRARYASAYAPVIESLLAGGVTLVELTLTTAGVVDHLPGLRQAFGQDANIGVGTVVDPDEAKLVLDAGAQFLVTPTVNTDVIAAAVDRGVPVFPGGLTPTELFTGWAAGATAVKVFPASTVGPGYCAQLRGPFPQMELVPSGGIGLDDAPAWITAGAMAVSIGGPLLKDAFEGGSLSQLTERCRRVSALVAEAYAAYPSGR